MSEVSQNIVVLAKTLEGKVESFDNGVMKMAADTFESTLPEGLNMKVVKEVQKHTADVVAASTLMLGQKSIPEMKKDGNLDQTSVTFKAGNDKVGSTFNRQKEVGIPPKEKGGERTTKLVYGQAVGVHQTQAGKGSSGELKKVRAQLNAEAEAVLKG